MVGSTFEGVSMDFLGWLFGYDYFVQGARGVHEYFSSLEEARAWGRDNAPAKVYRVIRGTEYHGDSASGTLVEAIK